MSLTPASLDLSSRADFPYNSPEKTTRRFHEKHYFPALAAATLEAEENRDSVMEKPKQVTKMSYCRPTMLHHASTCDTLGSTRASDQPLTAASLPQDDYDCRSSSQKKTDVGRPRSLARAKDGRASTTNVIGKPGSSTMPLTGSRRATNSSGKTVLKPKNPLAIKRKLCFVKPGDAAGGDSAIAAGVGRLPGSKAIFKKRPTTTFKEFSLSH